MRNAKEFSFLFALQQRIIPGPCDFNVSNLGDVVNACDLDEGALSLWRASRTRHLWRPQSAFEADSNYSWMRDGPTTADRNDSFMCVEVPKASDRNDLFMRVGAHDSRSQ